MDEARLLALIEEKNPEDLGAEECAALLAAAQSSPAIAKACRERILLEQRLAEVLGHPGLSVDAILARAKGRAAARSGPGSRTALLFGLALSALLLLVAAGWLLRPRSRDVAALRPAADAAAAGSADEQPEADPAVPVVKFQWPEKPAAPEPTPEPAAEEAAEPTPEPADASPAETAAAGPAPPPEAPWRQSMRAASRMRPQLLAFSPLAPDPPSLEVVEQWFTGVPGAAWSFGVHQRSGRPAGGFKGMVKLLAPLEPGSSLRMAIHDWNGMRIHAWSGTRGVTLVTTGPAGPWAGYATTRPTGGVLPQGFVLVATDAGRLQRTNPVAPARLELRHADGLLTLSRGDVRILDVPMASPPEEIFMEGFAEIAELALVPAAPLPPPDGRLADRAATLLGAKAGWESVLPPGSSFTELPDGRVALEAKDVTAQARVMLRLPPGPPRAVVLQIDSFEPGTGIVLGDAAGNPQRVLGFLVNQHDTKLRQVEMLAADGGRLEGDGRPHEKVVSFVAGRTWVRLVTCGGILRAATSPDGIHWAEVIHPGGVASVGLSAAAQPGPRRIVLGGAWVEPFPLLASLAPAGVPTPASALPGNVPIANWREAALLVKPAGIGERDWLLACAVRQLGGDASRDLAAALIEMLWRESLSRPWPAETRLDALAEVAALSPAWDDPAQAARIAGWYEELGQLLADEGMPNAYQRLSQALFASPLACAQPLPCFPAWLARGDLMDLFVTRSPEFGEMAARGVFYNLPGTPPLFSWAVATAEGTPMVWPKVSPKLAKGKPGKVNQAQVQRQGIRQRGRKAKRTNELRHPVALEATKEGITIAADIEAALSENALRDACRAIIGALSMPASELAPDVEDPDLIFSLPGFAAALLQDHPGMREAMVAEFEARGGLRLRQAVDSGDVSILEGVATQYPGTAAAAEASLLLGDRELAAGRFALARQRYGAARGALPAALAGRLAVSDGLAAGFLGEPGAVLGEGPVTVGKTTLDADAWRKLATELGRQRAGELPLGRAAPAGTFVAVLPAARDYLATPRARLEVDVGAGPEAVPPEYRRAHPTAPAHEIDWVARQTACVTAGPRLLVSNRFQLACYDGQSGQLQWRAGLANEVGNAHVFPGQPMRPIASATHAFVRRLRNIGPALAAIRLADGVVDWEVPPRPNQWFVASDPVATGDVLQACTAQKVAEGWMLALASFHPGTGRLVDERPLTLLRDEWAGQGQDCQIAWVADGLVITCGGGTISCDTAGRIRWVRQEPWVPPAVDPLWRLQAQTPPLVADGLLFVVQPADPGVAAIDVTTGRAAWKRGFAGVRRVLGLVGEGEHRLVVAERAGGLVALSVEDGSIRWRYDNPDLLDGCLVAGDGVLAAVHEKVPDAEARRPVLVWLDGAGGVRRTCPLAGLDDPLPRLGPFVPSGERVWALFGRGPADPTRDLLEITAQ